MAQYPSFKSVQSARSFYVHPAPSFGMGEDQGQSHMERIQAIAKERVSQIKPSVEPVRVKTSFFADLCKTTEDSGQSVQDDDLKKPEMVKKQDSKPDVLAMPEEKTVASDPKDEEIARLTRLVTALQTQNTTLLGSNKQAQALFEQVAAASNLKITELEQDVGKFKTQTAKLISELQNSEKDNEGLRGELAKVKQDEEQMKATLEATMERVKAVTTVSEQHKATLDTISGLVETIRNDQDNTDAIATFIEEMLQVVFN